VSRQIGRVPAHSSFPSLLSSSWAAQKSEAGGYIFEKTIGLKYVLILE
jgi:hypothetical protein